MEPKGRLIVKNESASVIITNVQIKQSAVWLVHWTGRAGKSEEITPKT
ncbi:MAG: hypothetical protein LBJ41_11785 [Treponema sp.]|jgi:hypothetical protein|nr:hypothetical protein [Treponema sp.]